MTAMQWVGLALLGLTLVLIIATECIAARRDRDQWDTHLKNVARFAERWQAP